MDWIDIAEYKNITSALVREIINFRVLKMREFLDCLTAFEFSKDSAQFSLGMRGSILPFSHIPPWSAQIIFY
jgi:hypothetical protein